MPDSSASLTDNLLLAALPLAELARITSTGQVMTIKVRQPLIQPDRPIDHVYFPLSGVMSLVAIVDGQGHQQVEVATIGNEGFVGLPVFLGAVRTPGLAFAQVEGQAFRMPSGSFRAHIAPGAPLHGIIRRYAEALFNQVAQSAACNRAHSVEQRCARWLLATHDRVGADQFALTQDFLAQMLGVRRATVTDVAGALQRKGLIKYARGRLTIANRRGLERLACPCYRIIRDDQERMAGPHAIDRQRPALARRRSARR
jgi:CRP-like cAMP-binding protein